MKFFHILALTFFLFAVSISNAQTDKAKSPVSATDTANLTILNIHQELFPKVSVYFKAETLKGEPLQHLTREKMVVKENQQNCEVVSLEPVSKNTPINIGLVIDHSASMQLDMNQVLHPNDVKIKISPLKNTKLAVKKFLSGFNNGKDNISISGFSSKVDYKLALTHDTSKINAIIDGMKVASSTALYDAMLSGIDQAHQSKGFNVLVVLAGGPDNASKSKADDVVARANKAGIPIYIIGLGNVNIDSMKQLAEATKGQFFYTASSSSLSGIYSLTSKKIQETYAMVYNSPDIVSPDTSRQVEISINVDSICLVTNPESFHLPAEAIAVIQKKDKQKGYMIYGAVGLVILIGAGILLLYFRRQSVKKKELSQIVIRNLYPNPSNGVIFLDYQCGPGQLIITNIIGQTVMTLQVRNGVKGFDLSELKDGSYTAMLQSGANQSNVVKFIIQR